MLVGEEPQFSYLFGSIQRASAGQLRLSTHTVWQVWDAAADPCGAVGETLGLAAVSPAHISPGWLITPVFTGLVRAGGSTTPSHQARCYPLIIVSPPSPRPGLDGCVWNSVTLSMSCGPAACRNRTLVGCIWHLEARRSQGTCQIPLDGIRFGGFTPGRSKGRLISSQPRPRPGQKDTGKANARQSRTPSVQATRHQKKHKPQGGTSTPNGQTRPVRTWGPLHQRALLAG